MKIGRNDPCPCGSGKKYKHCCLDSNIIPFPGQNKAQEHFAPGTHFNGDVDLQATMLNSMGFQDADEMKVAMNDYELFCEKAGKSGVSIPSFMEFMGRGNMASDRLSAMQAEIGDRVFESKEELEGYIKGSIEQDNYRSVDDFLGLSSAQMHSLITNPTFPQNVLFSLNENITPEDLANNRAAAFSDCLLKLIFDEGGSIPLTPKGNLKQVHCTRLVDTIITKIPVNHVVRSEDDFPEITAMKYSVQFAGYVDILNTRIRLTDAGTKYIAAPDQVRLFLDVLIAYAEKYDWLADFDPPEGFRIIQDTLPFSLYLLKRHENSFVEKDRYIDMFSAAFPTLRDYNDPYSGFSLLRLLYGMTFLESFLVHFGLVERDPDRACSDRQNIRPSLLFKKLFVWKQQ